MTEDEIMDTYREYDAQFRSIRKEKRDLDKAARAEHGREPSKKQLREAYDYFVALKARQRAAMSKVIPVVLLKILWVCSRIDTVTIAPPDLSPITSGAGKCFRKAMIRPWLKQEDSIAGLLFSLLLTCLIRPRRPLRQFHVKALSYQMLLMCDPNQFHALGSLDSLSITVENNQEINFREIELLNREWKCTGLVDMLARAPKLQQLRVEVHTRLRLPLRGIVGNITWPNLADVCLERFKCTKDDLIGFLDRHKTTLTELRLESPIMETAEWESCFQTIAGTFPRLKRVCLRGFFRSVFSEDEDLDHLFFSRDNQVEDEFTKKVQNFVLEGGDDMPESWDDLIPLASNHPVNILDSLQQYL